MRDLGYEWLVLDDCWHPTRDGPNGTLVPHASFFPDGMPAVIDYVHSKGLKFGLYTSVGDKTCHGGWSPGSYEHYDADAQTFADWKVDYVKVDYCGGHDSPDGHKAISEAMNKTGRPMILELCRGPYQQEQKWGYAPSIAQVWRATGDHHDDFSSTMDQIGSMKGKGSWSGPFGWAYGDMMMTGGQGCKDQFDDKAQEWDWHTAQHCPGQTDNEYRTEVSLYAVTSSPMMIGTDIRNLTAIMKETLFNKRMLAINQDAAAAPGDETTSCGARAWVRHLSDGTIAVALPNLDDHGAKDMAVCFGDVGVGKDWSSVSVYDVWAGKERGTVGSSSNYTAHVDVHDTLLVVLSKA
eukprot:g2199.t1